jgi:acetyl-CoA carboxylase biotin carboxyl carrier protein
MAGKSTSRGSEGSGGWNLTEICELIDVLVAREISEFEMEKGGVRIRIKRGNASAEGGNSGASASSLPPAWASPPPPLSPAPVAAPPAAAAGESGPPEPAEDVHIIKSPIVGTFYSSPSPSAAPFVNVGDVVEVGQPLCIIEAMKLMNEIESEAAGEIVRIYVENGQPVEYGQTLFAIRPSHRV